MNMILINKLNECIARKPEVADVLEGCIIAGDTHMVGMTVIAAIRDQVEHDIKTNPQDINAVKLLGYLPKAGAW